MSQNKKDFNEDIEKMSKEELKKINDSIEKELLEKLEQGEISTDEEEHEDAQKEARKVNYQFYMTLILIFIALINIFFIALKIYKLF